MVRVGWRIVGQVITTASSTEPSDARVYSWTATRPDAASTRRDPAGLPHRRRREREPPAALLCRRA